MPPLTLDEKWMLVKEYYEPTYRVKFKQRLPDPVVEELYQQMVMLGRSISAILDRAKPKLLRLVQHELGPQNS